jgi:hypothetical protein
MNFTMTKIAAAAVLAFAATGAQAVSVSSGGVFNMYSQGGLDAGVVGSNPAMSTPINVDATIAGVVDQAAGTWGVSSAALFYGLNWTASNGSLITTAGSYSLDTASGAVTAGGACGAGLMCFTVGANQVAGTIDFAWGATTGIRVANVWDVNMDGSLTAYAVPGMENGPFPGFNAAFNFTSANLITPVPEASTYGMMLAGLGLVGFAVRRRKLMA